MQTNKQHLAQNEQQVQNADQAQKQDFTVEDTQAGATMTMNQDSQPQALQDNTYQSVRNERLQLQARKSDLDIQIMTMRASEIANACAEIYTKMQDLEMTIEDLQVFIDGKTIGGAPARAKAGSKLKGQTVAAKYLDPETGATWTGRGIKPNWIKAALASGKELTSFLINKSQEPNKAPDEAHESAQSPATTAQETVKGEDQASAVQEPSTATKSTDGAKEKKPAANGKQPVKKAAAKPEVAKSAAKSTVAQKPVQKKVQDVKKPAPAPQKGKSTGKK